MKNFIICATRTMRDYASRVIEHVVKYPCFSEFAGTINGIDLLSTDHFADGEMEVVINSSIRGRDIVLFCSCARNEAGIETDKAKIEIYHTVDALKRAGRIKFSCLSRLSPVRARIAPPAAVPWDVDSFQNPQRSGRVPHRHLSAPFG